MLQRLARDGWLTIQHGKPTKVNNFWETSGLNILETLARLDHDSVPQLIDNLLSVRTNISTIFIRTAFRQHPDKALAVLDSAREVEDHADAFADLDYNIFRGLGVCLRQPDLRPDPQRHEGAVYPHRPPLFLQPGSAQPGAGLLSSAGEGVRRRPARSGVTSWSVATAMTAGRSGIGCRNRCPAI